MKMGLKSKIQQEDGVTLMISVLMLAVTTFVSFSLSAVILRELNIGRTILKTEPALSGASSAAELGLMALFRGDNVNISDTTPQSDVAYSVESNLYDNNVEYSIAEAGKKVSIALYDAADVNNQSTGLTKTTITNLANSNSAIEVKIFSWEDVQNPICQTTLAINHTYNCNLNQSDDRYIIQVIADGANAIFQVNAIPTGIPSPTPSLTVTGINGDVRRVLQVNLTSP